MKRFIFAAAAALFTGIMASAQVPANIIDWKYEVVKINKKSYELIVIGKIAEGWHTYDLKHEFSATKLSFEASDDYSLSGGPYEISTSVEHDGEKVFYKEIKLGQKIDLKEAKAVVNGSVTWMACSGGACTTPEDWDFSFELNKDGSIKNLENIIESADNKSVLKTNNNVSNTKEQANTTNEHSSNINAPLESEREENPLKKEGSNSGTPLWTLIIEAILWGFAMLLTPCVFPMVPMTISFFMKGSSSAAGGRFKAFMYGFFIVLLYTLPISAIIGITWLFGGDAVTADIFNWLATHWIPNIIFFAVFLIFAASFFGAFEITLPSSLINKSDKNSDKKGLAGVFFMALTLVLVSFSCTGPIVGSVLIKSTQGQFWAPMVTMLAFSAAFALPFTILALFPSLLNKFKKGGGSWLNSVKVVLGFIEVALALKFLSIPDQTYHWGLLDREVYLAVWIVVFSLLGFYLLGTIRFKHDDKVEHLGIFRLSLVIIIFSFVVYMIPGMFGAPLKGISGYIPPLKTQDFIIGGGSAHTLPASKANTEGSIDLSYGLKGYTSLEEGLEAAKKAGKPLFVDITGHGCTNCREMEQRVWSDPKVLSLLKNDFIIAALYTDDKTKLDEKDWITAPNGKVLKDKGRVNSYIVRSRFGVNAQPNYAILSPEGEELVPIRGYSLDVNAYVDFLHSGLEAFNKGK